MKILLYNIAYATGSPSSYIDAIFRSHRALKSSKSHFEALKEFIVSQDPDIIGLIEVDRGSYRTHFSCQAEGISTALDYQIHTESKYKHGIFRNILPVMRKQANAILTHHQSDASFHFLKRGVKRLVIEVDFKDFNFFLVHLALSAKVRKIQLAEISKLLKERQGKPFIIGGDFNTFKGESELNDLISTFNLQSCNANSHPTFPAWKPEHQLDYLFCSPGIVINHFEIPSVTLSDHLPLIADIEIL